MQHVTEQVRHLQGASNNRMSDYIRGLNLGADCVHLTNPEEPCAQTLYPRICTLASRYGTSRCSAAGCCWFHRRASRHRPSVISEALMATLSLRRTMRVLHMVKSSQVYEKVKTGDRMPDTWKRTASSCVSV